MTHAYHHWVELFGIEVGVELVHDTQTLHAHTHTKLTLSEGLTPLTPINIFQI